MKKLLVYLEEERHDDLKELAHRKKTTMAALVRYAVDKTFEDELDVIAGEKGLEEYLADPSSAISLDDLLKEMGVALPSRRSSSGKQGNSKAAAKGRRADSAGHLLAGG